MSKYKFIGLLILLSVISFSIPNISIGGIVFSVGFIILIVLRLAFKIKMNKFEIENTEFLNEKLKNDKKNNYKN